MRKRRKVLSVIAVIMLIISAFEINFDDSSWKENSSSYLMILSMSLLVLSMFFSNRVDRKG